MGHAVAQHQIILQRVAAQVEVAVLHTEIISAVGLVLDGKWRCNSRIEHIEGLQAHLYVAGVYPGVLALTLQNCTGNLYYVFAAQSLHLSIELRRGRLVDYNLCYTVTVPQVDEAHTAQGEVRRMCVSYT